jgi:hypothetical protein
LSFGTLAKTPGAVPDAAEWPGKLSLSEAAVKKRGFLGKGKGGARSPEVGTLIVSNSPYRSHSLPFLLETLYKIVFSHKITLRSARK